MTELKTTGRRPTYTNAQQGVAIWVNSNKDKTNQYLSGTLTLGSIKIPFAAFPEDYNESNDTEKAE